jgi:TRAP-type uncharacterized transport system fused permease subunit
MFIYGPQLLGYLDATQIAMSFVTATTGVLVLSVTCIGWLFIPLTFWERGLSFVSALFLMFSGWRTDAIGIALLALLVASAYWRYTRQRDRAAGDAFAPGRLAGENIAVGGRETPQPRD